MLIKNATVVNEGQRYSADILIEGERIKRIARKIDGIRSQVIDADGLLVFPGIIDDQVHFREPGLTHKGDIHSESRAAVAGGVTSYIDMPNTQPQTVTVAALNDKFARAAQASLANYSFMLGATNDNIDELLRPDAQRAIAVKVFMGASTGNMLVDQPQALERIFAECRQIIVAHCESEAIIRANREHYLRESGERLDVSFHPKIRSAEACYASSSLAVALAKKYNSRLHLFHLSTSKEMSLLEAKPLKDKRITGEVCVHHLWFSDADYAQLGNRIKWNPAVKTAADRAALRQAVIDGKLDVIATDHAPHTWDEKQGSCLQAASGAPMVQHSLVAMLELCRQGIFTEKLIVEKMAHAPAELFGIKDRGFLREGYYADIVLINPNKTWTVGKENLFYKCGWSPLEGATFSHQVAKTIINGQLVYDNGKFDEDFRGKELAFSR
ncbi:MAG: dihydroorotase [Candidatus Symbiothrix sp.]|jgi:dihydroorotase|nr:dihydroorotase [Candidatus Symbiothrix sp.]